jgi:hypothetical protein
MTAWMCARKWGQGLLVAASAMLASTQVQAYTVSVFPADQTVGLGTQVAVGVSASDFGGAGVGSYLLNVGFDSAILGFDRAVDALNLGFAFGLEFTISTGFVSLADTSLADPVELLTRQDDGVILFTLFFNTLSVGTSALDLSVSALSDVFGVAITEPVIGGASVTVTDGGTGTPVSAPGTLGLLSAAACAAALVRRRRSLTRG